jgi:hypothetical protein
MTPLDYALAYAAKGWHVFPVWGAENGKCRCGRECKSPGKHPIEPLVPHGQNDATTDPDTITRWWSSDPSAAIGVFLRPSRLVAVDIDPRNGGNDTIADIEFQYGRLDSDVMALTQSGGEHRLFQLPDDVAALPGKLGPGVDLKLNGYIIVEPSQGINGVYQWEASSNPLEGAIPSPLPDYLRDLAGRGGVSPMPQSAQQTGARFVSPETFLELRDALSFINADDYDTWVRVGMALRELGQQGFGLWDTWSQKSEKYDPRSMARKWASFSANGSLHYESVFALATENGWVNPQSRIVKDRESQLRELVEKHGTERTYAIRRPVAEKVLPFPVAHLNSLASHIARYAGCKVCHHVQLATLIVASIAAARRYESQNGDGANIYVLQAAPTVGALRPLHNAISRVLIDAGMRRLLREQRITSARTLHGMLYRSPASVYLVSDWGQAAGFAGRQSSGQADSVMQEIAAIYSRDEMVFDNPDDLGLPRTDASIPPHPAIVRPSLVLGAAASEMTLSHAFSAREIGRGATEQFIFHEGDVEQNGDPHPSSTPRPLIEHLRAVRGMPQGDGDLPLSELFGNSAEIAPTMATVRFETEPSEFYDQIAVRQSGDTIRSFTRSAHAQFRRLCTLLAACDNPLQPFATREIMEWAATFVAHRLAESVRALRWRGSGEDGRQPAILAVLETINKAGPDGLSETAIGRACYQFRKLKPADRQQILQALIEDEEIVSMRAANGRGSIYVAAEFIAEGEK